MVVRTQVDDGISVKTRTYRDVIKQKGLAEIREGFYAQREHCRWGIMVQLKGKQRIKLAEFGQVPQEYQIGYVGNLEGVLIVPEEDGNAAI